MAKNKYLKCWKNKKRERNCHCLVQLSTLCSCLLLPADVRGPQRTLTKPSCYTKNIKSEGMKFTDRIHELLDFNTRLSGQTSHF